MSRTLLLSAITVLRDLRLSCLRRGHASRFLHVMLAEAMQIFSVSGVSRETDSKPSNECHASGSVDCVFTVNVQSTFSQRCSQGYSQRCRNATPASNSMASKLKSQKSQVFLGFIVKYTDLLALPAFPQR